MGYTDPIMSTQSRIAVDVHFDPAASLETMREEVREGLTSDPKTLPSKYLWANVTDRLMKLPRVSASSLLTRDWNTSQLKSVSRVSGMIAASV